MSTFIWTAILCTCDIFASEINTLFYGNMVLIRPIKGQGEDLRKLFTGTHYFPHNAIYRPTGDITFIKANI